MHEQAALLSSSGGSTLPASGAWLAAAPPEAGRAAPAAGGLANNLATTMTVLADAGFANGGPPSPYAEPGPYADRRSTASSYVSRTGSGVSEGSVPGAAAAAAAPAAHAGGLPDPLALKALRQSLSRQGSLPGGDAAGAAQQQQHGSQPGSPPRSGAGTPKLPLGPRSKLGLPNGYSLEAQQPLEAALQGLGVTDASPSPASPYEPPPITFHAPPAGSQPPAAPPVEVFARFPQPQPQPQQPPPPPPPRALHHQAAGGPPLRLSPQHSPHAAKKEFRPLDLPRRPPTISVGGGGVAPMEPPGFLPVGPRGMPLYPGYGPPQYYPSPPPPGVVAGSPTAAGMPHPFLLPHPAPYYPGVLPPWAYHQAMGPGGGFPPSPAAQQQQRPAARPGKGNGNGGGGGGGAGAAGGGGPPPHGGYADPEYARHYHAMMAYMQGYGLHPPSSVDSDHSWGQQHPGQRGRGRSGSTGGSSHGSSNGRSRVDVVAQPSPSYPSSSPSSRGGRTGSAAGSTSITTPRSHACQPLVVEDKEEVVSEVLDRFKAGKEGREAWSLQDIRGHAYAFCRDQLGSRFVQQALDIADPATVLELFEEVEPKLLPLMADVFGNYVVQRFLQVGGEPVHTRVAAAMQGRVMALSLQMYGCRVVQKALEVFDATGRVAICKELQGHTQQCVRDQNGNHVVQKVIECVQPSDPAWSIIESIVAKTQQLSCHTFGCRLVQRVLEHCTIAQLKERAVSEVLSNTLQLSHDQFGNYVVQHLVAKGPDAARSVVVGKVAPAVMSLAQHKYASNVVEACFKHGSAAQRDLLIRSMSGEASAKVGAMLSVMKDQYGNYVVQRALEVADDQQRVRLLAAIRPHLASLRKYTYGKHIVARVEGMLAQQAQQEPQQQAATAQQQQQQPAASAPLPAPAPGEGPPEAAAGSEGLEGGKRGAQAAEPTGPVEEVEGQAAAEPTTAQ